MFALFESPMRTDDKSGKSFAVAVNRRLQFAELTSPAHFP